MSLGKIYALYSHPSNLESHAYDNRNERGSSDAEKTVVNWSCPGKLRMVILVIVHSSMLEALRNPGIKMFCSSV